MILLKNTDRQNPNNSGVFYMHGGMLKVHTYLVEDLDIRPEILFSSAQSLFALLKGRANKDQNFLFIFHYSHSA